MSDFHNINQIYILVTRGQVERLHRRFIELDKDRKGYLDRDDFIAINELAMNPLGDRLIDAFFTESLVFLDSFGYSLMSLKICTFSVGHPDNNFRDYTQVDDSMVNFRQFARVLAYFKPVSTCEGDDQAQQTEEINCRTNKLRCKSNFTRRLRIKLFYKHAKLIIKAEFSCILDVRFKQKQLYNTRRIQNHLRCYDRCKHHE